MIRVLLPWPAREVFPNYRQSHHWSSFTKARKAQRQDAYWAAIEKLAAWVPPIISALPANPSKLPMEVHFFPPDRRKRDDDGCVGAFKSARDGIADALQIDDNAFRAVYYFHEPEKPGRIEVMIG